MTQKQVVQKVVEKSFDEIQTTAQTTTTTIAPTGPPSLPIFIIPSTLPIEDINTIIEDLPDEPAIVMVGPVIVANNTSPADVSPISQEHGFNFQIF